MRRITNAVFLTLILVVQCMTGSRKCKLSGGDFTICVCTNRSGIQCSIEGISIPLNATTAKEAKCLQNVQNLVQKSKTCLCSKVCHTNERVARYRETCASQAVRTITKTSPQFATFCCKKQRVLIKLYFALKKEAFKELLTSITSSSPRTLSSYLTTTEWCRAFHLKCVELATVFQEDCEHFKNRQRRNVKEEIPSNTTTKQTNSTSTAEYENLQNTPSSLLSTSKQTMALKMKTSSTSRTLSSGSTLKSTPPLFQETSSMSSQSQVAKTREEHLSMSSTVYTHSKSTANLSIEPTPSLAFVSRTSKMPESTSILDERVKLSTKDSHSTSKIMTFSRPQFSSSSASDRSLEMNSAIQPIEIASSLLTTQSSLQLSTSMRKSSPRSSFENILSSSSTLSSSPSRSSQSMPSLSSRVTLTSSSLASLESTPQAHFDYASKSTVKASISKGLPSVTVLSNAFSTASSKSLTSSSLKSTTESHFDVSKPIVTASLSGDFHVVTVSSYASPGYVDASPQSQETVSSKPHPTMTISRSITIVLPFDKLVSTTYTKQNHTMQLASSPSTETLDVVKTLSMSLGKNESSSQATRSFSLTVKDTMMKTAATSHIDDVSSPSPLSSVSSAVHMISPSTTAEDRATETLAISRVDDGSSSSPSVSSAIHMITPTTSTTAEDRTTETVATSHIADGPSSSSLSSVSSSAHTISPSTTAEDRTMETVATSHIADEPTSSLLSPVLSSAHMISPSTTPEDRTTETVATSRVNDGSSSSVSSAAHITSPSTTSDVRTTFSSSVHIVSLSTAAEGWTTQTDGPSESLPLSSLLPTSVHITSASSASEGRTIEIVATSRIDGGPSDSNSMTELPLPSSTTSTSSLILTSAHITTSSTTPQDKTMEIVATSRINDAPSSSIAKNESLEYTEILTLPSSTQTSNLSSISSSVDIISTSTTEIDVDVTAHLSTPQNYSPTATASQSSNQENTTMESTLLPTPSVLFGNASTSWLELNPGISVTMKTKEQTAELLTSSSVSSSSILVLEPGQTKTVISKETTPLSLRSRNITKSQATEYLSFPTALSPSLTTSRKPSDLVSSMLSSTASYMGTNVTRSTPSPVAAFPSTIRSSPTSNRTNMKSSLYLRPSSGSTHLQPTISSTESLSISPSRRFSSSLSTSAELTSTLPTLAPSLSTFPKPKGGLSTTLSLSSVTFNSDSPSLQPKSRISHPSVSLPITPSIQFLSSVSEQTGSSLMAASSATGISNVQHLQTTSLTSILQSSSLTERVESASYFTKSKITYQVRSSSESLFVSTRSNISPSNVQDVMATTSIVLAEDYKETFLIIFEGSCLAASEHKAFKSAFFTTIRRLMAIESSLIDILAIQCGSVKVVFSIKCEKSSKIPEILNDLVKHGDFQVNMNGIIFQAINITDWEATTLHPNLTSTPHPDHPSVYAKEQDERRAIKITFILFASIFAALTIFGIVICIARSCGRKPYGRLKLYSSTLSTRGTNQLYKNELELVRLSPLHHGADYYGGHVVSSREDCADDDDKIDNRTALLNRLRNDEVASRRGKIIVKDDDSYSSIIFY